MKLTIVNEQVLVRSKPLFVVFTELLKNLEKLYQFSYISLGFLPQIQFSLGILLR